MDEEFIILRGEELVKPCCLFSGGITLGLQRASSSCLLREIFIVRCSSLDAQAEPCGGEQLGFLLAVRSHLLVPSFRVKTYFSVGICRLISRSRV